MAGRNGTDDRAGAKAARAGGPSAVLPQSPAAERNKEPILDVLRRVLPQRGTVLEVASGTGQHVVHFAAALASLTWQPTEAEAEGVDAIRLRLGQRPLPNVLPPLRLDVLERPWPMARADAVLCINMIHIAPWSAAEALFRGAADVLEPGAPLVLYGPFRVAGRPTAPSNEAFDASLAARDPRWGLRELGRTARAAASCALALDETVEMPANNLIVVFRRQASAVSGDPA